LFYRQVREDFEKKPKELKKWNQEKGWQEFQAEEYLKKELDSAQKMQL
jgi:hypothetical protein